MTGTIWDSAHKSADISLGRMSLIAQTEASTNGVWKGARATTSQSSGKFYLEYTAGYVANNGCIFGFGNSSFNTASYPGNDGNSFGAQNQGSMYGITGSWQGHGFGDIIGVAIDTTNKLVWYRTSVNGNWNNSGTANPATGTGGISYSVTGAVFPVWSGSGNAGADFQNGCCLNAGGFTFCMAAPSGFSAWDTGTPTGTGISGTTPTTWDSGNKNANVALTNGNLTATQNSLTSQWAMVRSLTSYDSGKLYFEIQVTAYDGANGHLTGLCDSSQTMANNDFVGSGNNMHSMGWQIGVQSTWFRSSSGTGTRSGPVGAVNHYFGFAVDMNRALWWVKDITAAGNWNNDAAADPTTGVKGNYTVNKNDMYIAWSGDRNTTSDAVVLNAGGTAFNGTKPTGYSSWDATGFVAAGGGQSAVSVITGERKVHQVPRGLYVPCRRGVIRPTAGEIRKLAA